MRIKCMPMKVAIAALILGWSMPALAADVDVPYVKAPVLPSYNWAGFYLGANLGGGFASEAASTPLGGVSINPGGVVGGVQLGYNFLLSPSWLVGIEGEFDWTSVQNTVIMTNPVATPTFNSDHNWYSIAGGRLGLVEGPWLYYFKGGAAWMNANYNVTNGVASDDVVSNRVGWTIGGGVEYLFLRNWSSKLEYDFLDFGNQNVTFPSVGATMGFNTQVHEVKLGLNYHWFP